MGEALRSGDIASAFRLSKEKAEKGDLESQYNVSLFYWHGVGAPQNFEEAVRWSTLSAVRGHRKAVSARTLMLRTVEPQLAQKAMEWGRTRLIKQAEGGDDDALSPLAVSYRADFGFANDTEAYFWSALAVSLGKVDVRRQRDALVQSMKQADLVKAQQRAGDWTGKWRKDRS
jgi:TPR repeat protein